MLVIYTLDDTVLEGSCPLHRSSGLQKVLENFICLPHLFGFLFLLEKILLGLLGLFGKFSQLVLLNDRCFSCLHKFLESVGFEFLKFKLILFEFFVELKLLQLKILNFL